MTDLNKINFMSKTRFDNLSAINDDELYAVKTDIAEKEWVINYFNSFLSSIYPVGSIYIGEQSTCPMQELISGSVWEKIEGKYLLASGELVEETENYSSGDTVEAGLPNITGDTGVIFNSNMTPTGAFKKSSDTKNCLSSTSQQYNYIQFDASYSNSIYGSSTTVRPPAFVVNVWKRIS